VIVAVKARERAALKRSLICLRIARALGSIFAGVSAETGETIPSPEELIRPSKRIFGRKFMAALKI
jgi:hypothetical protein